jgi:hypothetical protein
MPVPGDLHCGGEGEGAIDEVHVVLVEERGVVSFRLWREMQEYDGEAYAVSRGEGIHLDQEPLGDQSRLRGALPRTERKGAILQ